MMDSIQITGIRCYGYTGFLAEERVLGQWFEIDLTLWVDLNRAGQTDDINDTIDYRQAITIVEQIVKNAKFSLLEKLASVIAEDILRLNLVKKVRVQITKPSAPIPNFQGKITVDLTR